MINFIKMQGTGNDYIYIDCINNKIPDCDLSLLSQKISDRNYGVGSDGLILICKSDIADAKMVMFNKDGSEGQMCGNGIRCVGKYIYENILPNKTLSIETKSGIKQLKLQVENNEVSVITVDMGCPIFESEIIPVNIKKHNILNECLIINGKKYIISCVSLGNPHTVLFCDNVDIIDVNKTGNLIQKSNIFPEQCNVEFVQIVNRNTIKVRICERGSNETLSCGTGACASVVISSINNLINQKENIEVILKGGILHVMYDQNVYMSGPAETICTGKYLVKKH